MVSRRMSAFHCAAGGSQGGAPQCQFVKKRSFVIMTPLHTHDVFSQLETSRPAGSPSLRMAVFTCVIGAKAGLFVWSE